MHRVVSPGRRGLTLALAGLLHAFTHAYQVMLVPLYLLMANDLGLSGVKRVTLIVTLYGVVYCLLSYPAGILADRFNRKHLLGLGLIGNALAILLMGTTSHYSLLLALGMLAGLFGTLYHPTANALVPALYPKNPGMALGLLGIGSGVGFFVGAQYSGWRAQTMLHGWWQGMAPWQAPCLEMGLAGLVMAGLFLLLAREAEHLTLGKARPHAPMAWPLRGIVLAIALLSGCRDFAGNAAVSLISIYLQKAHAYDAHRTGQILGAMMLISILATPLAVYLSSGKRRLPGLAAVMIAGGLTLISVPHVPLAWFLPLLALFQVFHLGSYAISEVAMVERVPQALRGRAVGLYITLAGTIGSFSPWVVGLWTDRLGPRALQPSGYFLPFALMGALMMTASLAIRLLRRLEHSHPLPQPHPFPLAPALETA